MIRTSIFFCLEYSESVENTVETRANSLVHSLTLIFIPHQQNYSVICLMVPRTRGCQS